MGSKYINYVGPPNSDIWEVGQTTTDSAGNQWLCTARGFAGQPGTSFATVSEAYVTPGASSAITNTYGGHTASVATVVQNALGTDAVFTGYFTGAASVATFQVGTGSTAAPAMQTVATSVTATNTWIFPAYVPNNYYYSFLATQANGAASVPSSSLVITANPAR